VEPSAIDPRRSAHWLGRLRALAARRTLGPVHGAAPLDGFALLADYGIPVPPVRLVTSLGEALTAATSIGWPVVLKTAAPDVVHKSDVGGVRLGLRTPADVTTAYLDLAARLGPRMLISGSVPGGVEVALGLVRDPQLGPLVVVGAGGVLIEILRDRAVALPPLDRQRAHALLDRLAIRSLLDGVRGRPPADRDALATAIVQLGQLAIELGDHLDALDVNPVLAGPNGAVAVDVHVEVRRDQ
jgi:succinyl-CoA synthetase beta subunit